MDESILNTIKKLLGIDEGYDAFNTDIIVNINTFIGVLNTLGVGVEGFTVQDETATWDELLAENSVPLNEVKTYLYLRVRQVFDPPTSGVLGSAFDRQIEELGWRMMTKIESTLIKSKKE